uniref:Uncharacterized protein n=1 Tax=Anguilla anguilla TaxID=7936 RepID=A0A0E9RN71_ANGAN
MRLSNIPVVSPKESLSDFYICGYGINTNLFPVTTAVLRAVDA